MKTKTQWGGPRKGAGRLEGGNMKKLEHQVFYRDYSIMIWKDKSRRWLTVGNFEFKTIKEAKREIDKWYTHFNKLYSVEAK